jgi:hypothetical protein
VDLFDDEAEDDRAGVGIRMLRDRLDVRLVLGDRSDDLVLRPCVPPERAVLLYAGGLCVSLIWRQPKERR